MAFVSVQASAQETLWEEHMAAATKAYQQGRYAEAEKSWQSAVKKAEVGFGPEDQRVFLSLSRLVDLYHVQGRFTEAV
ncbi:MAG: tetratricopeptide repeat protein, partial [Deltaproteobacteria bacterium]|nr:tetratricopeptide repeat protein [Deltaproteobacteria bacterium]